MATRSKTPRTPKTPTTFGELRKLLAASGEPWVPDPTKSDEEALPDYPTGGDGVYEPASRTIGQGGLDNLLKRATAPSNPDLRGEWREAGLVADEPATARPKRQSRKKPSTTPAPDSGG